MEAESYSSVPLRNDDRPSACKSLEERSRKLVNIGLYAMVVAVAIFKQPAHHELFRLVNLIGFIIVVMALVGRIWCGIYVFSRKTKSLCTDGPYSACRNPLYIFSFFAGIGVAAQVHSFTVLIIFTAIFWAYYLRVIISEERRLRKLFGRDYSSYCSKVPRLLPNFKNFHSRDSIVLPTPQFSKMLWKSVWPAFLCLILNFVA